MSKPSPRSALFTGAALLCCAWLVACSRVPSELARTASFPVAEKHGRFVTVEGLQIFAITMGSGRDVLMIHGDPSSTWTWRNVMPPLAQRYRVHAIDLPGYGFSDKPDDASYDDAYMSRYVVGYLDEEHMTSAVLVGNSMGGLIASEVAIVHPERVSALVLIDRRWSWSVSRWSIASRCSRTKIPSSGWKADFRR